MLKAWVYALGHWWRDWWYWRSANAEQQIADLYSRLPQTDEEREYDRLMEEHDDAIFEAYLKREVDKKLNQEER